MKRIGLSCALAFCTLVAAAAVDYDLIPFAQAGSGGAYGDLFDNRGEYYSELGSASFADTGSYSPYFPMLLGGIGADLAMSKGRSFLMKKNRALVAGMELGFWGGAIKAETAGGDEFASLRLRSLVLSIHADERFRLPLGDTSFVDLSVGPLVGINTHYYAQEAIDGVTSSWSIGPKFKDMFFLGFGLGADYGFKLGKGSMHLGLRSDMGITRFSSEEGALGDKSKLPWRILGRASYEIALGKSGRVSE